MIAIIPARFGSEGVKDKNWRDFCGEPLVMRAVDFAKGAHCDVIVTTNSPSQHCLDVWTMCSEIHDAEARAIDVWRDAIICEDLEPDALTAYLEPSSPFRTDEDWNRCLTALIDNPWYQCAATVSPAAPPQKLFQFEVQDGHKVPKPPDWAQDALTNKPRQGMGRWYKRNGAVYMARAGHILAGKMMEERCCPVVSHGPRPNIDTEEDWLMAELLWKHQHG